jgi:maltooligosyltrehalose trehalohydrolase
MSHLHAMPFGASPLADGGVQFALWAPSVEQLVLMHGPVGAETPHPMACGTDGWHRVALAHARTGDHYRYRLPSGLCVPDPASRFNPDDVHGASQVIDPFAYCWQHGAWRGRPWSEAVIYEMHIGTFTAEGTFAAAQGRLADLAELGITAVELMPLADFPGRWGWGYDGVLPFAPDASYGTPDELKALVDSAHGLGLMVLIDVVYNHFGPEGNYLHAYCPEFFNPAHQTPWGAAINYDGADSEHVRAFFVHNALYWVEEFGFDGLRMDAIHAIRDDSKRHIVREICESLRDGPGRSRHVHVVLENDANQASFLQRDTDNRPRIGTAQWNDDIHHAIHVLTTGDTDGYYIDYADDPLALFGRALTQGFVYQGQASPFRHGELRGESSAHLPLSAFVSFLQTHDQVGNRAFGERIHALGDVALIRAATACVLLSPHVPMLFMGEEYAAATPFQYFCDFGPELAAAVSKGRRAEFGRFAAFSSEAARALIPDPNAQSTFVASKLHWSERDAPQHRLWLAQTRELLSIRRRYLVPLFSGSHAGGHFHCDGQILQLVWNLVSMTEQSEPVRLNLTANFGAGDLEGVATPKGDTLYCSGVVRQDASGMKFARGAVYLSVQKGSE